MKNIGSVRQASAIGRASGRLFECVALACALSSSILICWIGVQLFNESALSRAKFGLGMLLTNVWDVPHEIYGAAPFIFGTVISSTIALFFAVPISIGAALFLTEVAPKWLAAPIAAVIELLAAIPSIIFGLWGFLVLCPVLQRYVSPFLVAHFSSSPVFAGPPVITNMLAAGIILAIMITPIVTAISTELFRNVPQTQREASLGLGATLWETIRNVVLPQSVAGVMGGIMLGFGRAVGETMAVVMVVGNSPQITASLLKPGYTMPALLANQFNEAYTDDMQRSALLEVALILFAVTFLVNAIARAIILGSPKFNRLTLRGVLSESRSMLLRRIGLAILATALAAGIGQGILHSGLNALGSGLPLIASILFLAIILSAGIKMIVPQITRRHMAEYLASSAFGLCATCACLVLGAIFFYIASQGAKGLSLHFFTELPRPPGIEGGGLKSAIVGTIELVGIAAAIGIPVGVLGGLYLSEFARGTTLGAIASFAADVLNGIPSVVIGLFAYAAFVIPTKHFSAWAGGGALAVMTIPTITRTTQEVLMLLPQQYREAALGLGATRAQAIWTVILPAARAGILTGVILAIARVAGETAPLLFTAFGTDQLNLDPSQPVSSLTMKIYQYAISPYPDWIQLAWTGALVLLILIAISSVLSRVVLRR